MRLLVMPRAGAALFGPVSALIERENWMVAHLRAETGHLDEVFRTLTSSKEVIVTPPPGEAVQAGEKVDA